MSNSKFCKAYGNLIQITVVTISLTDNGNFPQKALETYVGKIIDILGNIRVEFPNERVSLVSSVITTIQKLGAQATDLNIGGLSLPFSVIILKITVWYTVFNLIIHRTARSIAADPVAVKEYS